MKELYEGGKDIKVGKTKKIEDGKK